MPIKQTISDELNSSLETWLNTSPTNSAIVVTSWKRRDVLFSPFGWECGAKVAKIRTTSDVVIQNGYSTQRPWYIAMSVDHGVVWCFFSSRRTAVVDGRFQL